MPLVPLSPCVVLLSLSSRFFILVFLFSLLVWEGTR